jgi:hypothetical protein
MPGTEASGYRVFARVCWWEALRITSLEVWGQVSGGQVRRLVSLSL